MIALQRSPFKLQITPSHEYQEYYTVQAMKRRSKLLSTSLVAASSQTEPSYSVLAILPCWEPHRVRLPEVAHQVQLLSVHRLRAKSISVCDNQYGAFRPWGWDVERDRDSRVPEDIASLCSARATWSLSSMLSLSGMISLSRLPPPPRPFLRT